MKKTTLILALAVFVFSCAKKSTPTASAGSAPSGNSGKVISGGAPAASSGNATATATPTPSVPAEASGSRTPAAPSTNASPEAQGQSIFNAKCGRCHGLKPASDYTADRWASIMAVMAPKARLTDAEKDNVMAYVRANAKK